MTVLTHSETATARDILDRTGFHAADTEPLSEWLTARQPHEAPTGVLIDEDGNILVETTRRTLNADTGRGNWYVLDLAAKHYPGIFGHEVSEARTRLTHQLGAAIAHLTATPTV